MGSWPSSPWGNGIRHGCRVSSGGLCNDDAGPRTQLVAESNGIYAGAWIAPRGAVHRQLLYRRRLLIDRTLEETYRIESQRVHVPDSGWNRSGRRSGSFTWVIASRLVGLSVLAAESISQALLGLELSRDHGRAVVEIA